MMVKWVGKRNRGPCMRVSVRQPFVRAFMEDITASTRIVIEAKWTSKEIEYIIN